MKAKKSRPKKYNEIIKNRDKPVSIKPKVLTKKRCKERQSSNSSDDSVCRRSSRLVGRTMASMEEVSLEDIIISSDADGENEDSLLEMAKRKKTKKKHLAKERHKAGNKTDAKINVMGKEETKSKIATPSKKKSPVKKPGTIKIVLTINDQIQHKLI